MSVLRTPSVFERRRGEGTMVVGSRRAGVRDLMTLMTKPCVRLLTLTGPTTGSPRCPERWRCVRGIRRRYHAVSRELQHRAT